MATKFSYDNPTSDQFDRDMHEAAEAVASAHRDLVKLEASLRTKPGMHEVADAVRRATLELTHPSVEGPLNHLGVAFDALRA